VSTALTKLALRYVAQVDDVIEQNRLCAEAMLMIASILHLGRSGMATKAISNDDADRLGVCLKVCLL